MIFKRMGLSVQKLSKRINKSAGWISKVETGSGTSKLRREEFERILILLDGTRHREMFRTWVARR
jgi:transcriptional regulator with XRE-family HTH domain